jgi:hypothetical protein
MMLSVEWRPIYKEPKTKEMIKWLSFLEELIQEPLRIANAWSSPRRSLEMV